MAKLWGGRFAKRTDRRFERFSESLVWDRRLLPYDLAIDAAHVKALRRCGVLTGAEERRLLAALSRLEDRHAAGRLPLEGHEDVHSAVQSALGDLVGPLADKLHTARSRNDLVAQSSRLYCKDHAGALARLVRGLQRALVAKAEEHREVLVPGMTHLQNAQVLSQAHIFLAYAEMLERSRRALLGARATADVCVLGSGALAGVTFALDQRLLARQLGLTRLVANSYDVAGDRDYIAELLWATALLGTHLSRIAEDLLIGQTKGFSLVDVDQAFCTGSSMMPQKKNADFLELVRGAAGVFTANLNGLLATLKGLPTSYNRDLQWDKRYLFDSVETAGEIVTIFAALVSTLRVRADRARELVADDSLYATDLADHLVRRGVPFKTAHEQVGRLVRFAEEAGRRLSELGETEIRAYAPRAGAGIRGLFNARASVRLKATRGSTHPAEIDKRIREWKAIFRRRDRDASVRV